MVALLCSALAAEESMVRKTLTDTFGGRQYEHTLVYTPGETSRLHAIQGVFVCLLDDLHRQ